MAQLRKVDWVELLELADQAPEEFVIRRLVLEEAQRMHVEELQAVADRTANQLANQLGPMLGKLIRSLAKSMRG